MKQQLKTLIDQFADVCDMYKPVTKWENSMMDKLCALQGICSKTNPDIGGYKRSREYIKANSGLFSPLKRDILPVIAWQMSVEDDPEIFFERLKSCMKILKGQGFAENDYQIIAALHIIKAKGEGEYETVASKMKKIYNAMKGLHPASASQEDYIAAAMLASTGITAAEYSQRVSRIKELLRNWMSGGNELQSVSNMILLFNVDDIALCERAIGLHQTFKDKGYNFKSHNMTTILALLAASKQTADEVTQQIIEAADYLKGKKGFGSFSVDKCQRAMLMTGLFLFEELGEEMSSSISSAAIQSMVVDYLITLQTICICCMFTAAAVLAVNSSE